MIELIARCAVWFEEGVSVFYEPRSPSDEMNGFKSLHSKHTRQRKYFIERGRRLRCAMTEAQFSYISASGGQLIAPAYVKPFVKRRKNDAADAEAICEAAQRPSMRFVLVKSEAQQAAAMVFRGRDLLARQRTQISNAQRSHMAEYDWVAPKGLAHLGKLAALLEDPSVVPDGVRSVCTVLLESLPLLDRQIAALDKEIVRRSHADGVARRLMTISGVGPITATAIAALAPPPGTFAKGPDFAAWVGLTPRQHSTGGKQKLGAISKMGERTLRRLLIIGSSAVVLQARKRGAPKGSWLEQMLARKPRMSVTVALANKTARIVWALLHKNEDYTAPAGAA